MAKQTKQAVAQRTQQRLAARKEAAQRGVETRKRNREARQQAQVEPQAAEAQAQQPEVAKRQTKPASAAMATVALRAEQAERFRALAAKHGLPLAKLLVRMMEVFEARG